MMCIKFVLSFLFIMLFFLVTGCQVANSSQVNWIYTIPDEYVGWIAILHECEDGNPLEEDNGVIEVEFGSDGLYCTSDSIFMWNGQISVRNQSGLSVPFYLHSQGESGYGVCCAGSMSQQTIIAGEEINMSVTIMWAGDMEQGPPETDTFFEGISD